MKTIFALVVMFSLFCIDIPVYSEETALDVGSEEATAIIGSNNVATDVIQNPKENQINTSETPTYLSEKQAYIQATPELSEQQTYSADPSESQSYLSSEGFNSRIRVARIEFGAAFGSYLGIRKGYTELGLFEMIDIRPDSHLFLEGRGFLLSRQDWAASLGIGFRKSLCGCSCSPIVVGANIYYDYLAQRFSKEAGCECCSLRSSRKDFGSLGIGCEVFSQYIDFRANAYLPVKESQHVRSFFTYPGGLFADLNTTRYIPYGIDAEISKRLNFCSRFYAVGAVGGYGYFFKHNNDKVYGPFARVELGWGNYISLQARYSYDQFYHSSVQGKVLFSIPFEELSRCFDECSTVCFDPVTQPVRRNYIPFSQKRCCWKWNW